MNSSHEAGAHAEWLWVIVCVCDKEKMRGKVNGENNGVKGGRPSTFTQWSCLCVSVSHV